MYSITRIKESGKEYDLPFLFYFNERISIKKVSNLEYFLMVLIMH